MRTRDLGIATEVAGRLISTFVGRRALYLMMPRLPLSLGRRGGEPPNRRRSPTDRYLQRVLLGDLGHLALRHSDPERQRLLVREVAGELDQGYRESLIELLLD
jgi:hypothetical protein